MGNHFCGLTVSDVIVRLFTKGYNIIIPKLASAPLRFDYSKAEMLVSAINTYIHSTCKFTRVPNT